MSVGSVSVGSVSVVLTVFLPAFVFYKGGGPHARGIRGKGRGALVEMRFGRQKSSFLGDQGATVISYVRK